MNLSAQGRRPKALACAAIGFALLQVAISSATTQYLAAQLGYQQALGAPLFWKVYPPFAWYQWQGVYLNYAKSLFITASIGFLLATCLSFGLLAVMIRMKSRQSLKHEGLHGTAHFASESEIRTTGLLPGLRKAGEGVYVGGWLDKRGYLHYLRHNGPEHVVAIAPTRSGKGVGLVVPTLLSWPHSVVVNDMKGELWALTAGWRREAAGNVVLKFDPAAASGSCAFNPLDEIRADEIYAVGDVQNLVTIIVDPDGKGLDSHWTKTAHAFLTGVILYLLHVKKHPGLFDVALALSDPEEPIDKLYDAMLANNHPNAPIRQVIAGSARDMKNRPDTERGSVLSTAMSFLSLYRDPLIARNIGHSDFRIAHLMDHTRPVSLYLVVRPADKDRMKPLMRLIINQIVRVLVRDEMEYEASTKRQKPAHRHRLLMLLDEFPSLGRLEIFQEALAYMAGYGLKAYLIMQDISQLRASYGQDESIISNCHVRVAYAPNRIETAKWLSDMTGTTTVVVEEISTSGKRLGAFLGNVTRSYRSVSRPLMTPDECMRLKSPEKDNQGQITAPGDMLVFTAGSAPILGTQILYFMDETFKEWVKYPIPETDSLRGMPVNAGVKVAALRL